MTYRKHALTSLPQPNHVPVPVKNVLSPLTQHDLWPARREMKSNDFLLKRKVIREEHVPREHAYTTFDTGVTQLWFITGCQRMFFICMFLYSVCHNFLSYIQWIVHPFSVFAMFRNGHHAPKLYVIFIHKIPKGIVREGGGVGMCGCLGGCVWGRGWDPRWNVSWLACSPEITNKSNRQKPEIIQNSSQVSLSSVRLSQGIFGEVIKRTVDDRSREIKFRIEQRNNGDVGFRWLPLWTARAAPYDWEAQLGWILSPTSNHVNN